MTPERYETLQEMTNFGLIEGGHVAELLDHINDLQRQLKIANLKCENSLGNNLCSDHRDKQAGKPCLACHVETLQRQLDAAREDVETVEMLNSTRHVEVQVLSNTVCVSVSGCAWHEERTLHAALKAATGKDGAK